MNATILLALLRAAAADPGLETVVTGSRTESSRAAAVVATQVVTRREIEESGATTLGELLESQPGVEVVRTFRGAGVRLQGLDPEYVLVLVDGARVGGRTGGVVDLDAFGTADIEQVEIVEGPASAAYGADALGGVINVRTRRSGRPLEGEIEGGYGSLGQLALRGTAGTSGPGHRIRLSADTGRTRSFDLDPADDATTGSAEQRLGFSAHADLGDPGTRALGLSLRFRRRDLGGLDAGGGGARFDRTQRTDWIDATLAPEIDLGPAILRFTLHGEAVDDQLLMDQLGSGDLDRYERSREWLGEAGVQMEGRAGSHRMSAGVEGIAESVESPRLGHHGTAGRFRGGAFVQDEWTLDAATTLVVAPGVRVDADSQFGTVASPRLAARIDPLPVVTLRAALGLAYRAPSFQELYLRFENPSVGYVVAGNPDLQPERSAGGTISAELRANPALTFTAGLFHNDVRDLIASVTVSEASAGGPTRFGYDNVERAITQGIEAGAAVYPVRELRLELGYTLLAARDVSTGRDLEGRARHAATFEGAYRWRDAGVVASLQARVSGRRTFYDVDDRTAQIAAPYATLAARLEKSIGRNVSAFTRLDNALDAGDRDHLPIPPRSVLAGMSARF